MGKREAKAGIVKGGSWHTADEPNLQWHVGLAPDPEGTKGLDGRDLLPSARIVLGSPIAFESEIQMRTQYVRLYTEEDGIAVFEDKEIEFEPGYAVPPAEPLHVAQFFGVEKSFWIGAPTLWKGEEPHPAPGRQIFVTVQGEYEVTAGDGAVRKFPAGRVLLLEDTTGVNGGAKLVHLGGAKLVHLM